VNVDLREFLSAYVAEVDEQLESANARLLEIEAALRQGEHHPRAVRDLFRALHTVKGLSAMVGVDPVVTISHRVESLLRIADRQGGELSAEAIDAVLQAVRAIEHRVREVARNDEASAVPPALLELLDGLEPAPVAQGGASETLLDLDPALLAKLAPFELASLRAARGGGRRALRAGFSPSPAKAERGLNINSVRERVAMVAEIVKVIPLAVPASEEAPGGLAFALLLVTAAGDEEIASALGIDPSEVHTLDRALPAEVEGSLPAPPVEVEAELAEDEVAPQRLRFVRVDVARLDDAMEHLSTLIVTRSRMARAVASLQAAGVPTRELTEVLRDNARQLRDLRASILRVRMVPLAEVLDRLPLVMRGLRRESGKQVRLVLEAGSAELDKGVAERLFPALVHLVRNAVDHAIESPEVRARLGKPAEGLLRIAVTSHESARLELTVSDDGGGVDRAAVARRAGREVASTDSSLLEALCRAGLSTREQATTTSGRGMGMDIVKRIVVDQLGGELSMNTEAGSGTVFTLRVPLTLTIVDAFTLDCRGQRFVVPVSSVEEILEVDAGAVRYGPMSGVGHLGLLERRGETVPLVDLGTALRMNAAAQASRQALLVRFRSEPMAFGLDRVIGQQEAVVRPLADPLVQVAGIAGATDLGDGKPTLVLDLHSLGAAVQERAA
jgi:two-component system chemotaxis sensor kinase CheA